MAILGEMGLEGLGEEVGEGAEGEGEGGGVGYTVVGIELKGEVGFFWFIC